MARRSKNCLGCTASYPPAAAVSLLTPVLGHPSFHQAGPGAAGPAQPGSAAAGGPRQPPQGRAGTRPGAPPRQPLCAAAGGLRVHGHQGGKKGGCFFWGTCIYVAHAYMLHLLPLLACKPQRRQTEVSSLLPVVLASQTLDELQRDAFPAVAASRPARALGTAVQVRAAAPRSYLALLCTAMGLAMLTGGWTVSTQFVFKCC